MVALVVWSFDPFYQYHAPFLGIEAVLNDRNNQMPGTVRNFSYDSVLVGSSVAENFVSSFLDETYGCSTLKLIRDFRFSGGASPLSGDGSRESEAAKCVLMSGCFFAGFIYRGDTVQRGYAHVPSCKDSPL